MITIDKLFPFLCFDGSYLLSKKGHLLAFCKMKLFDKCNLSRNEKLILSMQLKSALDVLDNNVGVYQFEIKRKQSDFSIVSSDDPFSVSHNSDLRSRNLRQFEIYFVFEFKSSNVFNDVKSKDVYSKFFKSLKSPIQSFKSFVNLDKHSIVFAENVANEISIFSDTLNKFFGVLFANSKHASYELIPESKVISFLAFLGSFDVRYLDNDTLSIDDNIPACLNVPAIKQVKCDNVNMLNFDTASPMFVSIASVNRFVGSVKPDFYSTTNNHILDANCDFLLFNSFFKFSSTIKSLVFKSAKIKEDQKHFSPLKLITGSKTGDDFRNSNEDIKKKYEQLESAKNYEVDWGYGVFGVCCFSESPNNVLVARGLIDKCYTQADARISWESFGLLNSYHSMLPANHSVSSRKLVINSHQYSALSFLYDGSVGQTRIDNIGSDKSVCGFEGRDGVGFHFSPWVGKKGLIICDGDTRGGKTFAKNFITKHLLNLGCKVATLDIDKGSYPLITNSNNTKLYELSSYNYNLFDDYVMDVNKTEFVSHTINLIKMLASSPLDEDELIKLESATMLACEKGDNFRKLSNFWKLLPFTVLNKCSRFMDGGQFDGFFGDQGLGNYDLTCFDFEKIYTIPELSNVAYYSLINQIITNFKYKTPINIPKYLMIDEAHVPLKKEMFANFIDLISRTGNKYLISFGLFSQSAYEYSRLDFWQALRTACSTFLFFPNSRLNDDLYRSTYGLTDTEIQTIKSLVPRKEFMIIQPEIGVSKVLRFNPDQLFLDNFTANPTDQIIKDSYYA